MAATEVHMPQLGESVTEGQVSRWLKRPGERVERDEPLLEVITDKVNAEVPSPVAGVLAEINVQEGDVVATGAVICSIGAEAEVNGVAPAVVAEVASSSEPPADAPPEALPSSPGAVEAPARRGPASPAVRRLAAEHEVDIAGLRGTGVGGRVTRRDLLQVVATRADGVPAGQERPAASAAPVPTPVPTPAPVPTAPPPPVPAAANGAGVASPRTGPMDELVALTPVRRAIAEHMLRSRQTSPHAWMATEVDASGMVAARSAARAQFRAREGVDLTYVPFVIKAVVESLRLHPEVNATWTAEGILRRGAVNISVAVSSPAGLVVPVVHDAGTLSIAGLAHRLDDLVARARAGRLKLPDIEGGTFCVNNSGTFGTVISAPIINQPQAAIMTMEAIVKRVVVLPGDVIAIRPMMFIGLSFDHRVMDGVEAASFLADVKKTLEAMGSGTPIY